MRIVFLVGLVVGSDAMAAEGDWPETLERVSQAVVSIRVTATRDFDTENASVSQGTGFVIDAENGLLLTNRHMVHAGPVLAEGVLLNHEEIDLWPVYRDPVHDFGFYRFDPSQVRHMDLEELSLNPDGAQVGAEIRVVGNDAGEKLSILDATLARLDRNAPNYGSNTYNDFNTFYIQAASNTSGGSSGSPVVSQNGEVVALNAGGSTGAASSFYLPLQRVVRAFELLDRGEPVSRGTLETTFRYTPYDELRRLGLQPETETSARALGGHGTGMLVVRQVVPGGPAEGHLEVGDILVSVAGTDLTEFVPLEAALDETVGESIEVVVERGGARVTVTLLVEDLHAITPDRYLEVGRGVWNPVSYQQARNHHRTVEGTYLAVPGYMWSVAGVPAGAVLEEIDGKAVPTLEEMRSALESMAQGQRFRVRFNMINDPLQSYEAVAYMDRRWYAMRTCQRNDATGTWPCSDSPEPPAPASVEPASAVLQDDGDKVSMAVAPALALVDFDIPHPTAGVKDFNYKGVGIVVDAEQGLMLVDRDTVPVALGDLFVTFAGSVRVPAELVYLHPVHNIAVIRYDPDAVGDTPVAEIVLSDSPLSEGDGVWLVGRDGDHELVSAKTSVDVYDDAWIGISATPRFRDSNLDVVTLSEPDSSLGGVVTDRKGRVQAFWLSFLDQASGDRNFLGLPVEFVRSTIEAIRAGAEPEVYALGADLTTISMADARERGLSDESINELLRHEPGRRRVLVVQRVGGEAPARDKLRATDLILAVNGQPATRMADVERALTGPSMEITLLRDGELQTVTLQTQQAHGHGVDRVLSWAGLVLHEPHREVAAQRGIDAGGVYIAWLWYGSPGARYGLRPTRRIVQVDDIPTPDLDALIAAVSDKQDREAVRIKMEALDGSVRVSTLKLDLHYWPTQVLQRVDGSWVRMPIESVADTSQ